MAVRSNEQLATLLKRFVRIEKKLRFLFYIEINAYENEINHNRIMIFALKSTHRRLMLS